MVSAMYDEVHRGGDRGHAHEDGAERARVDARPDRRCHQLKTSAAPTAASPIGPSSPARTSATSPSATRK